MMNRYLFTALVLGLFSPFRTSAAPPVGGKLLIQPASMVLNDRLSPHSILVMGRDGDGIAIDLTSQATFTSEDPKVAAVDLLGWVTPVAAGATAIRIEAAGQVTSLPVQVTVPKETRRLTFRHDVMPVLSRNGCNSGACHGYSLGKNGFKLSLRGADPDADFLSLTDEFFERRVNKHHPEASLLLTKPLGEVPHEGGVRFASGSLSHRTLLEWITQGAQADDGKPRPLVSLSIHPAKVLSRPRQQHQFQLLAHYADGTVRDVTRMGIFNVNTQRVAEIDDEGLLNTLELGESAVVARYERIFATANLIVLDPDPSFRPAPVPDANLIDTHVVRKLNDLGIKPSELADDATFLRRVHVDLIGLQPNPEEVRAFLANKSPDRRREVIEGLFQRPEFVDHWSLKWGDLLQNNQTRLSTPGVFAFREWIRNAVASNKPVDEFARDLLSGRGGTSDDPTSAYYLVSQDADDSLQRVTQVFCGVRMLCARCHPHPFENWTQADYYGLHSFFNQVGYKNDPRLPGVRNARSVLVNLSAGYSRNPRTGQLQPPRYLGGVEPKLQERSDRRKDYANWLTSPRNPFFARSLVNRYWSYFFHRGIIDPVDDIRTTNPPINPELLDALTEDFVRHKFDVRHLMRTIVLSQTYQRSSVPNETNEHDNANFSRHIPRRLPAETLLDSLVQSTGVAEAFPGAPSGFTAKQLPDATVKSDFLSLFGKPQRMEACECERDTGSNMLQALHFINGKSILGRVTNPGCRINALAREKVSDEQLVENIYLWCLARVPSPDETRVSANHIKSYGAQRLEAAQDLMWALLNSRDFLLVH